MTEAELEFFESVISEVFTVTFEQNSDEKPQGHFKTRIVEFTSAGLSI